MLASSEGEMKNVMQGFLAAALVLGLSVYGWIRYQSHQEIEAGAAFARKSDALLVHQLSMLDDGANTTVAEYFSGATKATEDLASCIIEIDSREWKYSAAARDSAMATCAAAKALISALSVDTRLRMDQASARKRSEKASDAISRSKNSYEIESLRAQMNNAFDDQIRGLQDEISNMKQNRERVNAMLEADSISVSTLGVSGLSPNIRTKLAEMYPEK